MNMKEDFHWLIILRMIHEAIHIYDYKYKFKDMLNSGFWTSEDDDPEIGLELEKTVEERARQIFQAHKKDIYRYFKRNFAGAYKQIVEKFGDLY